MSGGRRSSRSAGRGTTRRPRHPWVDVDGAAGVELAVRHLLERGHERIAWVGWPRRRSSARTAGPVGSARCRARPLTDGLAVRVADTVAAGREAAATLLDSARPQRVRVRVRHPRGRRTPHARGARPPARRDIAVVGFDDSQVAQVVPPGLTSVRQPLEQVALELVRALEALLAREPYDARGVLLAPTLAVRGSTGG